VGIISPADPPSSPWREGRYPAEIERRKEAVRRVWEFRPVDHIPVLLRVASNLRGWTVREHFLDGEKQLEIEMEGVKRSLELVPDDSIPSMRPDVGCVVIESALGGEVVFGDDPEQTCFIRRPFLRLDGVDRLREPDFSRDGLIPEGLRRIRMFVERTEGLVPVSCLDMGGPMNVAFTALGGEACLLAMHEEPEALERLAAFIARVFVRLAEASIEAAGGIDAITCTDFPYWWHPEGRKGHCSDDICSQYSPAFFRRFSRPFNSEVFRRFGGGMIHNCGPHPCAGEYLDHDPSIRAADIAWSYSKGDLPRFRKAFAGRGVLYIDYGAASRESLEAYRGAMEALAPDVPAIPCLTCTPGDDVRGIYGAFRKVAEEYARRMDWRGPPRTARTFSPLNPEGSPA
jgi:hypothetical protein